MALTVCGGVASVSGWRWGSWVGGSSSERRRSWSRRRPAGVWEPAPAGRGTVEHGPDQFEAGVLAGKPADHLHPPARLAEGAFNEIGVARPGPVLAWEAQVHRERLAVGQQRTYRRRVGIAPAGGEGIDAFLHVGHRV